MRNYKEYKEFNSEAIKNNTDDLVEWSYSKFARMIFLLATFFYVGVLLYYFFIVHVSGIPLLVGIFGAIIAEAIVYASIRTFGEGI